MIGDGPAPPLRLRLPSHTLDELKVQRLKRILTKVDPPPGLGYIIRTAGVGQDIRDIVRDLEYLLKLWNTIVKRVRNDRAPTMVYQESDLVVRTIRDVFTSDVPTEISDASQNSITPPSASFDGPIVLDVRVAELVQDASAPLDERVDLATSCWRVAARRGDPLLKQG